MTIRIAESDQDIKRGFVVMRELRPHITTENDFLSRVRSQMAQGYKLAILEENNTPVACLATGCLKCFIPEECCTLMI